MSFPAEKLLAVHQANVTLAFNIANTFMSGTEQLLALNLRTARSALENSLETSRSVMSGKTPTDLLDLPSSLGHPVLETTLGYLRSIYDIQLQTAEELAALTGNPARCIQQEPFLGARQRCRERPCRF
ncbi:MAG: phasin family protein [Rhodocyclaceae bacterium]|nr:phasin family protein [Rhodocyclaceae bacterium]